jgi:SAM-dependent methyltransferase
LSLVEQYRKTDAEQSRTADLLRLLPKGRRSVLDVGARDGHFSRLLTDYFQEVTALDLEQPPFKIDRVRTVAGDATNLQFSDGAFDVVFCAEVLEHIPDCAKACSELMRVAKHEIIIGVPYKQDTRVERMTCQNCGRINPPWGHVNTFDEGKLAKLFRGCEITTTSYVGTAKGGTNSIAAFLMDLAGNPWGTYYQEEPCLYCNAKLTAPKRRKLWQRACSASASLLNNLQATVTRPHANWIHIVASKR